MELGKPSEHDDESRAYRANPLTRVIWWIGGAIPYLLVKYPSEYGKYLGIGGAILGTWVLATLSSYLALKLVFDDSLIAGVGSAVWGLLIFNLDRFITVSMKKRGNTVAITTGWQRFVFAIQELLPALPRLAIAVIMGLLIAIPLEIKIFNAEVQNKLSSLRADEEISFFAEVDGQKRTQLNALESDQQANEQLLARVRQRYEQRKQELGSTLDDIEAQERQARAAVSKARDEWESEIDGTRSGKKGEGRRARELKAVLDAAKSRLNRLEQTNAPRRTNLQVQVQENETWFNDEVLRLNEALRQVRDRKFAVVQDADRRINHFKNEWSSGMLAHIKALALLSQEDQVVEWSINLFMALIFIIEAGPLLVKLISPRGPYDAKLDEMAMTSMAQSDSTVKAIIEGIRAAQYSESFTARRHGADQQARLTATADHQSPGINPPVRP